MSAGIPTDFPTITSPLKTVAQTYSHRSLLTAFQDFVGALAQLPRSARRHPKQALVNLFQTHRGLLSKLLGLVALGGLVMWNWKLLLALGVGVGVMVLVYALHKLDWQHWTSVLRQWLSGPKKLLILSVGTGSVAMLGTYMAAMIWEDAHSAWLATSIFLQGTGMMVLLALLSAQILGKESDRFDVSFDQSLENLAHPEHLKRLLAVRQLHRLMAQGSLDAEQKRTVDQALQLLLHQERESAVREALLHRLQPNLKPLNLKPRPSAQA